MEQVYNHDPGRRLVQGSWVAYPESPEFKASAFRSGGGIFTSRAALAAHSDRAVQQLTLSPEDAAALKAECEAAHLATAFPDSDINVYAAAQDHRKRKGEFQWRAKVNSGVDPMTVDHQKRAAERAKREAAERAQKSGGGPPTAAKL
jgi:hypothetical protein